MKCELSKMFSFCLVEANLENSEVGRFYEQSEAYSVVTVPSAEELEPFLPKAEFWSLCLRIHLH